MKSPNKYLQILAALILSASAVHADSSKEYALMGLELWSAFECVALASKAENTDEQKRLFRYGYKIGNKFIDALRANKIKEKDLSSTVPIGVTLRLQGPTNDFMLGQIYEGAVENALEDIFKTDGEFSSSESQKIKAKTKFRKANCKLLGNSE